MPPSSSTTFVAFLGLAAASVAVRGQQCSSVADTILGMGHNIENRVFPAASAGACCQLCRNWTAPGGTCMSWTHHDAGNLCYLHSTLGPAAKMHGAVSGVPHGSMPPIPSPPAPPARCIGQYIGCFKDSIPAPGVPPVRALSYLAAGPTRNMTVASCSLACANHGFPLAGVTAGAMAMAPAPLAPEQYSCYCGCTRNAAAATLPDRTCATPCTGAAAGDGPCGAAGAMATFQVECNPAPPANSSSQCAGNGSHPLPPGPACSQASESHSITSPTFFNQAQQS